MDKKREMMINDSFLAKTILDFTVDIDKAFEIFQKLHVQDSWNISQIESMLGGN